MRFGNALIFTAIVSAAFITTNANVAQAQKPLTPSEEKVFKEFNRPDGLCEQAGMFLAATVQVNALVDYPCRGLITAKLISISDTISLIVSRYPKWANDGSREGIPKNGINQAMEKLSVEFEEDYRTRTTVVVSKAVQGVSSRWPKGMSKQEACGTLFGMYSTFQVQSKLRFENNRSY